MMEKPNQQKIRERISGLHASYRTPYKFPDWCNDEGYQMLHDKFCQTARLVAPQNKKQEARLSIYQRQPVNIAMNTSGTNWKGFRQLQETLDLKNPATGATLGATLGRRWTDSYYTTRYNIDGILAANVAVYCETPVYKTKLDNYQKKLLSLEDLTAYERENLHTLDLSNLPFHTIRVLNLIGLGFDDPKQPDHKAFAKFAKDDKNAIPRLGLAIKWLQPHVTSQLQKVEAVLNWAHTSNKPIRYMHLPKVGCGAFAGDMPIEKVWDELSERAVSKWQKKWPELVVETHNMYVGTFRGMHSRWNELEWKYELKNCLFVNAWDPHSFVGNGNMADHSLDGWYGRFTAMAVLAWPGTNPYLWRDSHFIDSTPVEGSSEETRASRNFEAQKKFKHWMPLVPSESSESSEEDNGTLQQTATKETQMIRKPKPKPKPKKTTKTKKTGNGDSKYEEVRRYEDMKRLGAKILQTSCAKLGQSKFCQSTQGCEKRSYRPGGKTKRCYRMAKKTLIQRMMVNRKQETGDNDPKLERWLRRQKREYLMGRHADM
jgi:hypothetical protein